MFDLKLSTSTTGQVYTPCMFVTYIRKVTYKPPAERFQVTFRAYNYQFVLTA